MPLIDPSSAIIGSAMVCALLLMFGFAMHGALGTMALSPFGNAGVMIAGFFGTLHFVPMFDVHLYTLGNVVIAGVAGAFALLVATVLTKLALTWLSRVV